MGTVGQVEVGIDNNRAVILTQKDLDSELRELIWSTSQLVFEIKNSITPLKLCLYENKEHVTEKNFPILDFKLVDKYEEDNNKLGVIGMNSDGNYKLISKESYISK